MRLVERPCNKCGTSTANTLIDLTGGKRRVVPMCTRCTGGPVDELADHPVAMPESEVLDFVDCPQCGAARSLPLPVDRPPGSVVGAEARWGAGGVSYCVECHAKVEWGVPMN